jgi:heme/copper-type cytochrome/quinol oxidase subunit 2
VAVAVEVKGGKVSPPPGRVNVPAGSTVRLTVTSDVADEIHVHGYELEAPMQPGKPAVVEFVATKTGQFEVETHESGKVLTQLLVR